MIDRLSDKQASEVERFLEAMLTPVHSEALPPTWLATETWRETFVAWLQGYHVLSAEPLGKLQFEAAFNAACEVAGWRVEPAKAGQRFYDTTIYDADGNEKRISLKASSAEKMAVSRIEISKLTEAAWIQGARRQVDRRNRIVEVFLEYQETTSSIFILRGFKGRDGFAVLYELTEIPTSLFDEVGNLTIAQAGTISIPSGTTHRSRDFAIGIDKINSKIKLSGIRLDICTVHGRWGIR